MATLTYETTRREFTPEQLGLFKDLLYHTNEIAQNIFIPYVLGNRQKTINSAKEAKKDIDRLLEVL
jgi:hypothetical protein